MSVFSKIFGPKKPKVPPRDVAKLIAGLECPAAHAIKTTAETKSYFGGLPSPCSDFIWPHKAGVALGFLGQVDLSQVHIAQPIEWLPRDGVLMFFYDVDKQPWGFDPKDKDSWAVLYQPPTTEVLREVQAPTTLKCQKRFPKMHIEFRKVVTYPWDREEISKLTFTDEEFDIWFDVRAEAFGEEPKHQMGGFPDPTQDDDMERECQLVSNGLYCGDSSGSNDPKAKELERSASDWKLLFQFDFDEDLGFNWGDLGLVYFWVRKQDARSGDFGNTWVVLQCT